MPSPSAEKTTTSMRLITSSTSRGWSMSSLFISINFYAPAAGCMASIQHYSRVIIVSFFVTPSTESFLLIDPTTVEQGMNGAHRSFLAMVPRGLEHSICAVVRDNVPDAIISIVGAGGRPSKEIGLEARDALLTQQRKKMKSPNPWFVGGAVGSIEVSMSRHISVGYTDTQSCTWSVPGTMEGTVWMRIETKHLGKVSSLRCFGPLISLIATSEDIPALSNPDHSLDDIVREFSKWLEALGNEAYYEKLESSLQLWKDYVEEVWKDMLDKNDFRDLEDRIQSNNLRFRLSCMRDHIDASYTRQDFLRKLMDAVGSTLLPSYSEGTRGNGWVVDLKKFDVEFVVILLSNGFMAMGVSLVPYSFYNAKSFGASVVPPDISKPYLGHENLHGIVRLRPTTAHMLLHVARIKPFETVLDPCAGIGTIPIEADKFLPRCIGIGGDVVLGHPTIATAAASMEHEARNSASSLLAAWDAAHLPVRSSVIDACVSDLPFGKQCMSSNLLKQLLPLVFLECARVLVPHKGRILMLCGSPTITESLFESQHYWKQPCSIATPVNIGGLSAWIFRIERNGVAFDPSSHPRKQPRARSIARRRDLVARHQESAPGGGDSKKRRIQR